jgi:hypothetical protein
METRSCSVKLVSGLASIASADDGSCALFHRRMSRPSRFSPAGCFSPMLAEREKIDRLVAKDRLGHRHSPSRLQHAKEFARHLVLVEEVDQHRTHGHDIDG